MTEDSIDMFEQMDDMFARLFSRMDREFSAGTPQVYGYRIVFHDGGTPDRKAELPATPPRAIREPVPEVHQIGNETKVITELPGATDDMIRLEIKESMLVIDAGDADHHYHTTASLPLVDTGSMQRSFKNGVLEVTLRNLTDTRDITESGKN
jgi:HSP20 family protein